MYGEVLFSVQCSLPLRIVYILWRANSHFWLKNSFSDFARKAKDPKKCFANCLPRKAKYLPRPVSGTQRTIVCHYPVDRFQSLFYFVPQESHRQVGSSTILHPCSPLMLGSSTIVTNASSIKPSVHLPDW